MNTKGKVLEEGDASQIDRDWWEYVSTTEGTIEAAAWDLAGNVTKVEK